MTRLITALLASTLACGSGIAVAQQTSPNQSKSPQEKQDVPQGNREGKSPNLKSQRSPKPSSPGTGNAEHSRNTPDSNNPDLQQQNKPAPKKKSKKSTEPRP